ncbi:MAG: SPFH domain-containing protein [Roseburia sp.]|nr:SPFH domain-containing protein [Roseburia sp.]
MGLFKKNPNETAYVGGRKHFVDVIKNSGVGDLLIWRQPEEDFNTNSTLIVMPGEQAIFINGGKVEQVFENGTYKLSTKNYPFISRLKTMFSGGISAFNCVVYFVRTAHGMEIRWGTDSPIQVRDKLLGIATKLRCRGSYKVQVEDPVKFLEKLVGNNIDYQTQDGLGDYFVNEFQSKIKSTIARAVNESNAELLGIDARLDEFSDMIQPYMQAILDDYGLRCVKFVVSAIDIDDDELRRRYDELGMDQIATIRKAQADKGAMDILGDDWGKQQASEILRGLANNKGAGGVTVMGAGLGAGVAAGGVFNSMAQQMFEPMAKPTETSGKYLPTDGDAAYAQAGAPDPVEALGKLKKMLDAGLITQSEYDAKKAEILSRM